MSDESVYRSQELTEYEWQLVDRIKRTVKVLARVTRHRDLDQVRTDIDPQDEMGADELDALAKEHRTPDLPGLNDREAADLVGALGPAVLAALSEEEDGARSDRIRYGRVRRYRAGPIRRRRPTRRK